MDLLNFLYITHSKGTAYEFAHSPTDFILEFNKTLSKSITADDGDIKLLATTDDQKKNKSIIEANLRLVSDKLEINDLLWRLESALANSKSTLLQEKFNRAKAISSLITNFVLLLVHNLYWINLKTYQKSSLSLKKAFDFAIDIGKDLVSKFEQRLNKEYNLTAVIESEFKGANIKS